VFPVRDSGGFISSRHGYLRKFQISVFKRYAQPGRFRFDLLRTRLFNDDQVS